LKTTVPPMRMQTSRIMDQMAAKAVGCVAAGVWLLERREATTRAAMTYCAWGRKGRGIKLVNELAS